MAILQRTQHWTDESLVGRTKKRTIRNWENYKTPTGVWAPTSRIIEEDASQPPDWEGTWDFRHRILNGPAEVFFGDGLTPGDTAMVGMRLSDRPGIWLNIKAMGVNNVDPVVDNSNNRIRWPLLWQAADLRWNWRKNGLRKTIRLRNSNASNSYRFSLRMGQNMTHEIIGENADGAYLLFRDGQGREVMRSRPVFAWYDDGGERVYVPATIRAAANTGAGLPTIRVLIRNPDLNAAWAAGASEVFLDPSTTISGSSDLEDTWLHGFGSNKDKNMGGDDNIVVGTTNSRAGLIRAVDSALPGGTASRFEFFARNGGSSPATNVSIYQVASGNDWVQGSSNFAIESGACAWNYAKYSTQEWNGGQNGCQTSGTDYTADASPPVLTIAIGQGNLDSVELPTSWMDDWGSGAADNEGFIMLGNTGNAGTIASNEHATVGAPYIEVDYEEAISGHIHFYTMMGQQ